MPLCRHLLLFLSLCIGSAAAFAQEKIDPLATSAKAIVLTAAQVKSLGIESRIVSNGAGFQQSGFPGTVLVPHDRMRLLSAPFAGMVESIYGAPGLPVKKGQWLIRLSAPDALALRRDRQQAVAADVLAQQSLKRDEILFAEGIIAESRLQATRAAATQARALLNERQDAVKVAGLVEVGGGIYELRAPMDGVILEMTAQVGQRVDAAALLGKVAKLDRLWVDIQVPASVAQQLQLGQKLGLAGGVSSGRIMAIGRAVDASQSVLLRGLIEEGSESLVPGQSVEVSVYDLSSSQPSSSAAVKLPASALVRHQGGDFVFVQQPDKRGEKSGAAQNGQQRFIAIAVSLLSQSGETVLIRESTPQSSSLLQQAVVVRGASGLKAIWAGVGRE